MRCMRRAVKTGLPHSPDLKPLPRLDYSIWGSLRQLVYRLKIRNVEHLKQVLVSCWEQISDDLSDQAVGQFWERLASVTAVSSKRVEHCFD